MTTPKPKPRPTIDPQAIYAPSPDGAVLFEADGSRFPRAGRPLSPSDPYDARLFADGSVRPVVATDEAPVGTHADDAGEQTAPAKRARRA